MMLAASRARLAATNRAPAGVVLGRALAGAAGGPLRKTPLWDSHVALGGKMVEFGGWDMPVQYPAGIVKSHEHTRKAAGLFDVSHMLGCVVRGADRVAFMEKLCTADIKALPDGMGSLTVITNEGGGVIDDCIITNAGDHLYMVINAGHEEIDLPHIKKHMDAFVAEGGDVSFETLPTNGILALQGPKAAAVLQKLVSEDLSQMGFMCSKPMTVAGIEDCFVARSGYTGEDGFEIAVPKGTADKHGVVTLWETLLADTDVMPVGLGARDSLRLEAGLCLYGNDLDTTTSPAEGTLFWVVAKSRRVPGGFVGSERILEEITNKSAKRKRAGFVIEGAPARQGTAIMNADGDEIGVVSSGGHSPMLKKGVGMCYVKPEYNKAGTELYVMLRKKKQTITISKMPFVPQNYYRGP